MFKAGDRIGFRRTEYGKREVGTYVGSEGEWDKKVYVVRLDNGEVVKFNYRVCNGGDAKSSFVHHIGYVTVRKDFIHCDRGYECAAWYENIQVLGGSRYPVFLRTDDRSGHETLDSVFFEVEGEITSDEFGSRLCGVPISNYDNKKNAGKHSSHYISYRPYEFGCIVLRSAGDERYADRFVDDTYEFEVFGTLQIEARSFRLFVGDEEGWTTDVSLVHFEDLAEELKKYLQENDVHEEVYVTAGEIEVEIEWGDWKHDHQRLRWLVINFFAGKGIAVVDEQEVTDENDSDVYSAVHRFRMEVA